VVRRYYSAFPEEMLNVKVVALICAQILAQEREDLISLVDQESSRKLDKFPFVFASIKTCLDFVFA
jgi:hypothetical protein